MQSVYVACSQYWSHDKACRVKNAKSVQQLLMLADLSSHSCSNSFSESYSVSPWLTLSLVVTSLFTLAFTLSFTFPCMLTDVVMDVAGGLPQCTLVTHLFLWPSFAVCNPQGAYSPAHHRIWTSQLVDNRVSCVGLCLRQQLTCCKACELFASRKGET